MLKTETGLRPATLHKNYGFHPRRGVAEIHEFVLALIYHPIGDFGADDFGYDIIYGV